MYKKNILAIHLNSQIVKGFTAILFILTALIFSSRLVGYFEQAAAGSLNPDIIFSVIFLRLPDFLALLIPFAFFLSLLLVVSELYQSNGIYAYFSAGVSRLRLIKHIMPFFFITLISCSLISVYLAPYGKALSKSLIAEQSYEDKLGMLQPQSLINLDEAGSYLYFDSYDGERMTGVTFFVQDDPSLSIIKADLLEISNQDNNMILDFKNGSIYPDLNSANKIDASFKELTHSIGVGQTPGKSFTLSKLLDYKNKSNFIESQWNASIPAMLVALLVLSFVFGKENPRSGREGSLVTGVLIYIFYLSVLVAFRESYSDNLNFYYHLLWPVHLAFLSFGAMFFWFDGRVSLKSFFSNSRMKTISLIFFIFLLLAWLST
ncbi:LptF/LptG family permease [Gammaproteobacteria bacterium]|nr:LptF/LptG family permease [Gammaproteobacteria bacterium]MDA9800239.1 LptF/LptG family permease [Gammaproteobacteria bacterium]